MAAITVGEAVVTHRVATAEAVVPTVRAPVSHLPAVMATERNKEFHIS